MDRFLRDLWYLALRGETLRPGAARAATILGEKLLIGRRSNGAVFAFADRCPHRGMPLQHARREGDALRCCFHGWKFALADGLCCEIPGLDQGQAVDTSRFRLKAYPCREVQGNVWVFMAAGSRRDGEAELPPVPMVPGFGDRAPRVGATIRFSCSVDVAVIGFCDPLHPPFVHTSRWWNANPAALRSKEKHFEPTALGFRMKRHPLSSSALPYRILGEDPAVEIDFALPGWRVEHIQGARHAASVLTAATPIDAATTEMHCCLYWTPRWLTPLKPVARWLTHVFLRQDRDAAAKLGPEAEAQPMLFLGDPDAQIRWYYRLKSEYQRCQAAQEPFVNPLKPATLRWRS